MIDLTFLRPILHLHPNSIQFLVNIKNTKLTPYANLVFPNSFKIMKLKSRLRQSRSEYLLQCSQTIKQSHAIEEYIEYYNEERIKSRLKGLTPKEYRNQASINPVF